MRVERCQHPVPAEAERFPRKGAVQEVGRVQRLAARMSIDGVEIEGETRHRMNAASLGVVEPFSSRLLRVTLVTKQDANTKFKTQTRVVVLADADD